MSEAVTLFWFRRDLRLEDVHGLYRALNEAPPVLPLFIFDTDILERLEDRDDRRMSFLYDTVRDLHARLAERGCTMLVERGRPVAILRQLLTRMNVTAVYADHDHEPNAIRRDDEVKAMLAERGIPFHTYKDHSIFERDEVVKDDGSPYTVFTPYMRKWRAHFSETGLAQFPSELHLDGLLRIAPAAMPSLKELGFKRAAYEVQPVYPPISILRTYASERDRPTAQGTTGIGVHLRFGTVSVRRMVKLAREHSDTWLNELIWREFFMQILWHYPHVEHGAFRPAYDRIPWRNNENEFAAWCQGRTGFPLVDAGMRQLRATGMMHNRVRMVVASFLTKHLLIDWRWGEAWFARWLMDFELSSNNGNWQWAAGSGCDAAPYFRVFNPQTQLVSFDPRMEYVLRWAPEYGGLVRPTPVVEHAFARTRAMEVYARTLKREGGR